MDTRIVSIDLGVRSYDIYIGAGLLHRFMDFMPDDVAGRSVFIVADRNADSHAESIHAQILAHGASKAEILVLPEGEKAKSFGEAERILEWLLSNGVTRNSLMLAVGGGVVGDITGFCASVVLRGIPYIQVPTTLLAQVDSSVGGKTGINTPQGKNLVGSFYHPQAVIADIETLKTLPDRQIKAGYAEIVKYGLINDPGFFAWLERNGRDVCALRPEALIHAIETSIKAKAEIVMADERESGRRALLNLGHTFGHALEAACGFDKRLLHGEAVALGIIMAFDVSVRMGLCPRDDYDRVEAHFSDIGLPLRASFIDPPLKADADHLIDLMRGDKKAVRGEMTLILANGIGQSFVSRDAPEDMVLQVLKESIGNLSTGKKGRWTSAFSSHS